MSLRVKVLSEKHKLNKTHMHVMSTSCGSLGQIAATSLQQQSYCTVNCTVKLRAACMEQSGKKAT